MCPGFPLWRERKRLVIIRLKGGGGGVLTCNGYHGRGE